MMFDAVTMRILTTPPGVFPFLETIIASILVVFVLHTYLDVRQLRVLMSCSGWATSNNIQTIIRRYESPSLPSMWQSSTRQKSTRPSRHTTLTNGVQCAATNPHTYVERPTTGGLAWPATCSRWH